MPPPKIIPVRTPRGRRLGQVLSLARLGYLNNPNPQSDPFFPDCASKCMAKLMNDQSAIDGQLGAALTTPPRGWTEVDFRVRVLVLIVLVLVSPPHP
jgi:hypothetical protein